MKISNFTIYDTPVIKTLARWFSLFLLKILGWRTEGQLPDIPKYVLIAAPHTSNWDLLFTVTVAFAMRVKIYWLGKNAIFSHPFGFLFSWLGGVPIDRSKSHNVVEQSVQYFNNREEFVLTVPPSGTRRKVSYWKTGFYYIAVGAKVPILLGFLDYKRKVGGVGPVFPPTGDIEADMEVIREFYSSVTGKYPEKALGLVPQKSGNNSE
ncbi:MAG: glycerol acyltransferase [Deltaproteobacteria bacterium]|nr:glycerol acyltransferase [Deltaproteobacteria bacterium]